MRIDGTSVVSQGENTFTLQTQGEEELELVAGEGEGENTDWIGDIEDHRQDFTDWHQAATSQMEILSPSKKVGGTRPVKLEIFSNSILLLRRWKGGK